MVDSKYTSTLRKFVWQEAPGLSFVIQQKLRGTVYDQQMRIGDLETPNHHSDKVMFRSKELKIPEK